MTRRPNLARADGRDQRGVTLGGDRAATVLALRDASAFLRKPPPSLGTYWLTMSAVTGKVNLYIIHRDQSIDATRA